jgi:hydroxymethylglutaryl-CoA lyase
MIKTIDILEVGPRDGLQMDPNVVPTADKVELVRRLLAAGIRRIEVTSFVNPKLVPQMADAEALLSALPRPAGVYFTGLVLNRKGFDRAVAAGCNEIGMVVVASDTFNRRNQSVGTEQSIQDWLQIAPLARAAGVRPQVTVSAAFGCPFEGEVPIQRVLDIVRRVAEAEPYEICFADTIGVGVPAQVTELIHHARDLLPGMRLRCHFHNTRNTGIANAYAALEAGVSTLDASLGGIGGCPFAPGAAGNIATEDLLYMLQRSGVETGVSLPGLIEAGRWLQERLGRTLPGMLMKTRPFPPPATSALAAQAGGNESL